MRVRVDGQNLDVHGQPVRIANPMVARAGRYIYVFAAQAQHGRASLGRRIGKEQADAGLNGFLFAGRQHVQL